MRLKTFRFSGASGSLTFVPVQGSACSSAFSTRLPLNLSIQFQTMKASLVFSVLLLASTTASFGQRLTAQTKCQLARIEQTLGDYLLGQARADSVAVAKSLLPQAQLLSVRRGALVAQPAQALQTPRATGKIVFIDVQGTAAIARVESGEDGQHTVDFLSLLEINGAWTIVQQVRSRGEQAALTAY